MVMKDAARSRGYANNDNCSARNVNANNSVANTNRNYAGSAQVEPSFKVDQIRIYHAQEKQNYKTSY